MLTLADPRRQTFTPTTTIPRTWSASAIFSPESLCADACSIHTRALSRALARAHEQIALVTKPSLFTVACCVKALAMARAVVWTAANVTQLSLPSGVAAAVAIVSL